MTQKTFEKIQRLIVLFAACALVVLGVHGMIAVGLQTHQAHLQNQTTSYLVKQIMDDSFHEMERQVPDCNSDPNAPSLPHIEHMPD